MLSMKAKTLLGSLLLSQIGGNGVLGMFDTISDTGGSNSEPCPLDYQLLHSSDFQYSGAPIEIVSQDTSSVSFKVHNVWSQDGSSTAEIYTEYSENNSIGGVNCEMFADIAANQDVGATLTAQCFETKPESVVTLFVRDPDIDKTIGTGKVPQCCHADLSLEYAVLKFTYLLKCVPTCDDPTPFSSCGDGTVNPGEECDDGNKINDDSCTNLCTNAKCGDGIMQGDEECDDGNKIDNDNCTNECKIPIPETCGDGVVDPGEECDEGGRNDNSGSRCKPNCTLPPGVCPIEILDFNELPDAGFIYDEWWTSKGVMVVAESTAGNKYTPRPSEGCTTGQLNCYCNFDPASPMSCSGWNSNESTGAARVFDTSKPTGYPSDHSKFQFNNPMCDPAKSGNHGDPDLGSPNEGCPVPGPGVGAGGAPLKSDRSANPFANCPEVPIGKVLIIQENKRTCADDIGGGGTISFIFDTAKLGGVTVEMGRFLDIDDNEDRPEMNFWPVGAASADAGLAQLALKSGHNGLTDLWVTRTNIAKTSVTYDGSGCIAQLRYRPTNCPSRRLRGKSLISGPKPVF